MRAPTERERLITVGQQIRHVMANEYGVERTPSEVCDVLLIQINDSGPSFSNGTEAAIELGQAYLSGEARILHLICEMSVLFE